MRDAMSSSLKFFHRWLLLLFKVQSVESGLVRTEIQRLRPRTLFPVDFKVDNRVAILLNLIVALVLLDCTSVFLGVGCVVWVFRYMRMPPVSSHLTLEETILPIKGILIACVFGTMEGRMTSFF